MKFNYQEISDTAYKLHKKNMLDEAEKLYKELLNIRPDDVNVLNLIGLLYLAKHNTTEAINYLSRAYILKKSAYIASNLAKAYYFNSEPEKAIKIYKQALSYEENDDIYYSIALAYKKLNDYENIILNYKKAIEINPKNYSALYNLSLAYKDIKDINNAIFYAEKCIEIRNDDDDIFALLSGYYEDKKDYELSIEALRRAIFINNKKYIYFYNLGVLLSKKEHFNEAEAAYMKSIELNNTHIESYINLASLYKNKDNNKALEYLQKAYDINQTDENLLLSLAQTFRLLYRNRESIEILEKLTQNNKNCAEAYSQIAINYMDLCDYNRALENYNLALSLNNENLNYKHGKAVALKYLGCIEESKEILEQIITNPDSSIQSTITLGMLYLADRQFEKGMKLYTQRSKESKFIEVFKEKIWNKEVDLKDKNVLVYSDCGFGDTLMYSRFLPILNKQVKSLTLQTDKELLSLLRESLQGINIIKKSITPPQYDIVMSLMDIQYALNMDFSQVKNTQPYLTADINLIKKYSLLDIFKTKNKKIGLCWQGNKRIFKNRSINFEYIKKLISKENCTFYSFQMQSDIQDFDNFYNLKDYINDFSDTAALLMNMDLIITIDSSVAHLAGALGIKTYLLLPKTAEWRWFYDEEKTIWYNSVRIFRQNESNNWEEVIERVYKEI